MRRGRLGKGAGPASKFTRFMKYQGRSLCASLLAVSMVVCHTGPAFNAGSDGGDASSLYEYEFDSEELYWALQDAIEAGRDAGTPEFEGAEASAYEELFADEGQVYRLNVELKGQDDKDDLQMAVYARLNADGAELVNDLGDAADARYQVTGGEEFVFLLENGSDVQQSARIVIDGVPSEAITAEPYSAVTAENVGPAAEESTAAAEESAAESEAAETAETSAEAEAAGETEPAEGAAAEETGAAPAQAEETAGAADAAAAEAETEASGEETGAADAAEVAGEPEEQDAAPAEDADIVIEEETEDAGEADAADEEPAADAEADSEVTVTAAAVSAKKVARVAASVKLASPSDAEKTASPSDAETATESDAQKTYLDGETYAAAALGKKAVTAYVIGAEALGLDAYNDTVRGTLYFPDEQPENMEVKVKAPEGAFTEPVKLVVSEIAEDSDAYQAATDALDGKVSYTGMKVLDIRFVSRTDEATEVQPACEVEVTINVDHELAGEADSMAVHHLVENENGVLDIRDEADVTDDEAVLTVDHFSLFAATSDARASATDKNSIVFKHIQTPNDNVSIGNDGTVDGHGWNVMKYSIVLVNLDGTVSYDLPAGSVVPDTYTFNSTTVDMSSALTQMGLSIPGYTLKDGWAFFWWTGNYSGAMYKVPYVKNFGVMNSNFNNVYYSYLGFQGLYGSGVTGSGSQAGYDAYMNATFASSSTGDKGYSADSSYYAYNPTGTLRIVFFQVSDKTKYKSNFVDAYDPDGTGANQTVYDTIDMNMTKNGDWDQQTETYQWYGTLASVPTKTPAREGYIFDGWYTSKDEDGNGTGTKVTQASDDTTHYNQDSYYYARWVLKTYTLKIEKHLTGNMYDIEDEFSFEVKGNKQGMTTAPDEDTKIVWSEDKESWTFDLKGKTKSDDEWIAGKRDCEIELSVPAGAVVTVTETNNKGYTSTTYEVVGSKDESNENLVINDDRTVIVTNDKTIATPTGVFLNVAPYLAMLAAAGAMGLTGFTWAKRRRDEQ